MRGRLAGALIESRNAVTADDVPARDVVAHFLDVFQKFLRVSHLMTRSLAPTLECVASAFALRQS